MFACEAKPKIASVCAAGNFKVQTGSLIYRFGKFGEKAELVYGSSPATVTSRFDYQYDSWGKGEETSLKFKVGKFAYVVHHAHGAFGVDGGANRAGVWVSRGMEQVADIECDETSTVNRLYDELNGTNLDRKP
ncbi:hypothetical protein [uncultured Massilia sp.]|uniref:hypothetical protein n=1 Tax=uncultured Massilia sp. TaxID=169973 RepID=UPI0025898469|nr:hypothetical protein [uncultured Massilia sp.]